MIPRVRRVLVAVDDRLQQLISLKTPAYTADPNVLGGQGVYTAEEWAHTRRLGAIQDGVDGHQYDSDDRYAAYLRSAAAEKVAATRSLMTRCDFSRYRRVLELGCGDMIQACTITRQYPALTYVATDFDEYVVERCRRLAALDRIDKRVLDVRAGCSAAVFAGSDLVLSFGLDAVLDDEELAALVRTICAAGAPYLMCSPTTMGPLTMAHRAVTLRPRRLLRQRRIRMHGWARSVAWFRALARREGLRMEHVGRHGPYTCLMFAPAALADTNAALAAARSH